MVSTSAATHGFYTPALGNPAEGVFHQPSSLLPAVALPASVSRVHQIRFDNLSRLLMLLHMRSPHERFRALTQYQSMTSSRSMEHHLSSSAAYPNPLLRCTAAMSLVMPMSITYPTPCTFTRPKALNFHRRKVATYAPNPQAIPIQ